ncbi:MAG: DUF4114 domain-containing protein [Microcoleaceae cyanobacterium]
MKIKFIATVIGLTASTLTAVAPAFAGELVKYNSGDIAGFDALLEELDVLESQGFDVINTERKNLDSDIVEQYQVDLSQLKLVDDYEVKVHFLHEGAWYRNQLGYTATGASEQSGLIFEDIVCRESPCLTGYRGSAGAANEVLSKGDYKSLGTLEAGTQLDFFLNRDAYGRDSFDTFYTDSTLNSDFDKLPEGHAMAYAIGEYIVMGWEDIKGGGDRDYNDVVFALELGQKNIDAIKDVPEPATTAALFGLGLAGVAGVRRRKQA